MSFSTLTNKSNVLYYACDCGASGTCVVKPSKRDSAIVVDIICPHCEEGERVLIAQYSSDKSKKAILKDINTMNLEWSLLLNYEI